jgi:hypothetical protein
MSTAYRTPGRDIDETEIRRAEIHEAAETKRKVIEERAATRRARIKEVGIAPYVVAGGVLGMTLLVVGVIGEKYVTAHAPPPPPPACQEWAEVISHSDSQRECKGGRIFAAPSVADRYMVRCVCGAAPAVDGGP